MKTFVLKSLNYKTCCVIRTLNNHPFVQLARNSQSIPAHHDYYQH